MLKKIMISLIIIASCLSCEQPNSPLEIVKEVTTINNIPIIWKGSLSAVPQNPQLGWAYYNTLSKKSYVWDGDSWEILAQDGISIIWKGELPSAPPGPQLNWAYHNIIDGNSYIWNGSGWDLLAKAGRDGASGILLWLGSLAFAPSNPSTGNAYYNTAEGASYIWDGDSWKILAQDGQDGINGTNGKSIVWQGALSGSPSNPQENWAYYDTISNTSYIWDGDSWEILAETSNATIMISIVWKGSLTAAPINPQLGWMYYNSLLGKTYVWDGSSWDIVSQDGQDGTSPEGFLITWKGGLSSAPSNPQKGWAYYDTDQKKSYIWDGSSWQILAQDGANGTGVIPSTYLYMILYTPMGNYFENASQSIGTVDFGKVGVGSSIRTTTFYISQQGSSGTTFNLTGNPAIQVSGTDTDCFTVTQPSITTAPTGTYITDASIAFTPVSIGQKTVTITIPNNSPDKPNFSFTVTGTGSLWPKTYDSGEGDGNDAITCSVMDSQGNIYFAGYGFELINHHSGSDWWIKKIDSSGNEVTSGWDKKIDLNGSTSTTYDKPTNAVIDGNDSLIVSDGYYTIKFDSDGTELWRKNVGGTLYLDSQNNVFIVASASITKYDGAGALLWSKSYTGRLSFDASDNILVYSGDRIRYLTPGGSQTWSQLAGDTDNSIIYGGYNSSIGSEGAEYWSFPAIAGRAYAVSWNDSSYGDGTKTGRVYVSAYWEDNDSVIFAKTTGGWSSPVIINAAKNGNIIIKVEPYGTYYSGTYGISIRYTIDSGTFSMPATRTVSLAAINSAVFDTSGNIYIAGYGYQLFDQYSKRDVWIKKYDASGVEITSGWNKKYDWGHSDDEYATRILFDATNIIVTGRGNDLINGASADDGWGKVFDTSGTLLSEFIIPDANAVLLRVDNSGDFYFSTDSASLRKYNSSGILQFALNSNSPYISSPIFVIDANNNIYISGCQFGLITPASNYDWIIKKFNGLGVEQ
jgi:hypothetical protein